MSTDRGMKKWAPYSSLIEQATCLEQMRYERNKIDKPTLTVDQIEKINYVLQHYNGGEIKIKFYYDGYIYYVTKPIKKIDVENKRLIFDSGKLNFSQILDLDCPTEY